MGNNRGVLPLAAASVVSWHEFQDGSRVKSEIAVEDKCLGRLQKDRARADAHIK